MDDDDAALAALEAAVGALPDDTTLRLHLADMLLRSGLAERAARHVDRVLSREPDSAAALRLAAASARAVGDGTRAESYERIVRALGAEAPNTAPDVPVDRGPGDAAAVDSLLADIFAEANATQRVTLDDVGGMEDVKAQLQRAFLGPLRHPELRRAYGASLRGGLLLYGPPGCGKTFIAGAVAGELGAAFVNVGLHDVLDMWFGISEHNLHEIFQTARRLRPCVLFFDEIDALGQKRSHLRLSPGRNVVAQLLAELDGLDAVNEGVFVLGTSNQPWDIDPALRRPGRFDRTLLVLPPDAAARAAIVELHLRDRPVGAINYPRIATRTEGFSGADLRAACDAAAQQTLERSIEDGIVRPIETSDLERAITDIRPSTRPWFETARNYVTFANATGEFDELLTYMRKNKMA